MSRKTKPRNAPTTGPHLAEAAQAARAASRHKEAIEHYKALLKTERRPEWLAALADAYAGRAMQLAEKGLLKEALALWRTRSETCAVPLWEGPYVAWLLAGGEQDQALRLLAGGTSLPPEIRAELEAKLAAAVLVAPETALNAIPADSAMIRHRTAARDALGAFARGDDQAMAGRLASIPFRSPYRDLRAILKAAGLLQTDPTQAQALLSRVPLDGPFEPLAGVLRVCLLPGTGWVAALPALDPNRRELVFDLKGVPGGLRGFLVELARLPVPHRPEALFDLLMRFQGSLPPQSASALCHRLLPHVPERIKTFEAGFGKLAAPEKERILALADEVRRRPDQAEDHWLRVAEALKAEPSGHLRAALVLRHLADVRARNGLKGAFMEEAADWLADSLDLDPQDRATHLHLIRTLRGRGDLKTTRSRLEAALAQFPADAEVLLEAVETALASNAFKKAVTYAKRVLELDPINARVRVVVGHAHLGHARKLIVAGNAAGAQRELDEAGQWLRAPADCARIKLLRALLCQNAAEGTILLREAIAELGGRIVGSFCLLLEAGRTKHPAKPLLRRAESDLTTPATAAEVLSLAHTLNATPDSDKAVLAALASLRAPLERAGLDDLEKSDTLTVCEALHRRGEQRLVKRYAEAALRRWPGSPVFIYLAVASTYGTNSWRMPERQFVALEQALDRAQAEGDQRTVLRLRDLLSGPTSHIGLPEFVLDDVDPFVDEVPAAALHELMQAMGGEEAFLEMVRNQLGKSLFEQLRRQMGGNKQEFAHALVDMLGDVSAGVKSVVIGRFESGAGEDAEDMALVGQS